MRAGCLMTFDTRVHIRALMLEMMETISYTMRSTILFLFNEGTVGLDDAFCCCSIAQYSLPIALNRPLNLT